MIDQIESKASFMERLMARREEKKAEKSAQRTGAAYIEALSHLSELRKEWHIKRLIAYTLPGQHIHMNPVWKRSKYPSGETL